jgi:hypothetical protein
MVANPPGDRYNSIQEESGNFPAKAPTNQEHLIGQEIAPGRESYLCREKP